MRAVLTLALALALVMVAQSASAIDARDARGLSVAVGRVAEPLVVDGLVMHVERAQGPQVGELARRIEDRWRQERNLVIESRHGDWHIRSRWVGVRSEVIQWRGEGDQAELLLSWFDASRKPGAAAAEPVSLPPGCVWGRRVEGRSHRERYMQLTARCRSGAAGVASRLDPLLARHDWTVVHKGALTWDVMRQRETARVTLVAGASPGDSALVWITTVPDERP